MSTVQSVAGRKFSAKVLMVMGILFTLLAFVMGLLAANKYVEQGWSKSTIVMVAVNGGVFCSAMLWFVLAYISTRKQRSDGPLTKNQRAARIYRIFMGTALVAASVLGLVAMWQYRAEGWTSDTILYASASVALIIYAIVMGFVVHSKVEKDYRDNVNSLVP